MVGGLKVLSLEKALQRFEKYKTDEILLALPSVGRVRKSEIIQQLEPAHLKITELPGLTQLVDGELKVADIREVDIIDLLGRDPVPPVNHLLAKNIHNKVVMVTGAASYSREGKQIVYGGLRMGGRSYYALNLQDMSNPKLLFQISPDEQKIYYNGSSSTYAALDNMGQSWSKPSIGWVNWKKSDGKTTERKRVMFVGGGYDEGYENDTYNPSISQGAGVYMFDADNGKLLWWASAKATTAQGAEAYTQSDNLKYSVVSEIRTEDRNGDGLIDHLYFGDLGGQLFRIDLDNTATTNANFAKPPQLLLNLNNGAASPRFYEMPAFSVYDYNGTTFAVVLNSASALPKRVPFNTSPYKRFF